MCGWPLGSQAERGGQDPFQTLGAYFPAGQCLSIVLRVFHGACCLFHCAANLTKG